MAEAVAGYVGIVVDVLVLAKPRSLADRYGRAGWLLGRVVAESIDQAARSPGGLRVRG
jgi:hypothetical protein